MSKGNLSLESNIACLWMLVYNSNTITGEDLRKAAEDKSAMNHFKAKYCKECAEREEYDKGCLFCFELDKRDYANLLH